MMKMGEAEHTQACPILVISSATLNSMQMLHQQGQKFTRAKFTLHPPFPRFADFFLLSQSVHATMF